MSEEVSSALPTRRNLQEGAQQVINPRLIEGYRRYLDETTKANDESRKIYEKRVITVLMDIYQKHPGLSPLKTQKGIRGLPKDVAVSDTNKSAW